jgi:DNA-binding transcriptional LysR family regulator
MSKINLDLDRYSGDMGSELELRHLRYFVAVAEELHFGRAAVRLQMAQPPLSQQIRKLEAMIGAPLFNRTSRSVTLTPAGEAFLFRAQHTLAQARADLEEARRIGRGEAGRLDVGFIGSAVLLGVTDRIRAFRSRFPAVHLRLHEGFTTSVLSRLLEQQFDLGVVRDAEPHPELDLRILATEGFVAVLPADHPAAVDHDGPISASALRGEPFVLYPRVAGELAYRRNLQPCQEAGYEPDIVQEASNWNTILALVGAGLGVTIAPESAAATAPPTTRVLPLLNTTARSEVQFVRRTTDRRAILDNFCSVS